MDRRAHLGMDQPLSSAGTRLRASRSKGGRVRPPRHDPPHAAASRSNLLIRNRNFPEGLLEARATWGTVPKTRITSPRSIRVSDEIGSWIPDRVSLERKTARAKAA